MLSSTNIRVGHWLLLFDISLKIPFSSLQRVCSGHIQLVKSENSVFKVSTIIHHTQERAWHSLSKSFHSKHTKSNQWKAPTTLAKIQLWFYCTARNWVEFINKHFDLETLFTNLNIQIYWKYVTLKLFKGCNMKRKALLKLFIYVWMIFVCFFLTISPLVFFSLPGSVCGDQTQKKCYKYSPFFTKPITKLFLSFLWGHNKIWIKKLHHRMFFVVVYKSASF